MPSATCPEIAATLRIEERELMATIDAAWASALIVRCSLRDEVAEGDPEAIRQTCCSYCISTPSADRRGTRRRRCGGSGISRNANQPRPVRSSGERTCEQARLTAIRLGVGIAEH